MSEFLHPADQPIFIASAELQTPDLPRLRRFYETVIGLETQSASAAEARLGVGDRALLTLREDKALRPNDPRASGLFHLAFLLPGRADLGAWLGHARAAGAPLIGGSDHGVSEALYLEDPDGNGVEIYADKPFAEWPKRPGGGYAMTTEPLNLRGLIADAPQTTQPWRAPEETVLGHAHLQVGSVAEATAHYRALGFETVAEAPGAAFLSTGGYHHHLALNAWRTRGAGRRPEGMAGLAALRLGGRSAREERAIVDPFGLTVILEPVRPRSSAAA